MARWSSGLRHCSFTAVTPVRFWYESPYVGIAESAGASDSKSDDNIVWVQVPLSTPKKYLDGV